MAMSMVHIDHTVRIYVLLMFPLSRYLQKEKETVLHGVSPVRCAVFTTDQADQAKIQNKLRLLCFPK
jgi:hypothetical protein